MVEQIIEFSARNRFIVFLLVFSFSAVGVKEMAMERRYSYAMSPRSVWARTCAED